MTDDALPTGARLADALANHGLGPPDPRTTFLYGSLSPPMGEPWRRIEDCWYLVGQLGLTIERFVAQHDGAGNLRRPAFWRVDGECGEGLVGVSVDTFNEVPTAICQASLLVAARRAG